MRRGVKVLGWALAFSASFAVGAVIAAHSDPFPPGVIDPGAAPAPTVSPASPSGSPLAGTLKLQTAHNLYVGGACRTDWKGALTLQEDPDGAITGTGTIGLLGDLHCDFPVIQVQTETVTVSVVGSATGQRISLTLTLAGRDPKASSDFGGLTHTVGSLDLAVPVGGSQQVDVSRPDGDRGSYTAAGTFAVR